MSGSKQKLNGIVRRSQPGGEETLCALNSLNCYCERREERKLLEALEWLKLATDKMRDAANVALKAINGRADIRRGDGA